MIPQTPQQAQAQPQNLPMPQGAPPSQPPGEPPVTIDAVMRLLRDNVHRRFRIDIETDSTIASDEAQDKQDRVEFITGITKIVESWGPIVQGEPFMAKLAGELMLFGVRAFRTARTLEGVIEETVDKFEEMSGMPKPPPQPSPDEMVKLQVAQAKGQSEVQKAQIDAQTARIDAQARIQEVQLETQRAAQEHAHSTQQAQTEAQLADQKIHNEAASNQMKAELEMMQFQRKLHSQNLDPERTL